MSSTNTTEGSPRPVDVAVFTQFFPPEGQGGGHRWQKFIQHQQESNLQYRVICPPASYPFGEFDRTYRPWETETIDGIRVTRLWTYQPHENTGNLGRMLNYGVFSIIATLYLLCNFWRYDCVVTMSTPHTTFLPGAVGKALGRTWIVDIFDLWLDNAADLDYVDVDSLGYQFVAWLEQIAFHRADHVVVLTPTMKEYYLEKYDIDPDRITPVPFGVDAEVFTPELGHDPEPRIIYVGNLGTFYAFEPYLRAFASLDDQYELYIIGWGEERERLEKLCTDLEIKARVTFTGRVPREEVAAYLSSAALNWVPLETDYKLDYARPTKLLEGMAVGTPYIASPLDEINIVTEESKGGIIVKNEPEDIAESMEHLLTHAELRQRMAERAVEFIESNHRWPSLSNRIQDVIVNATHR